jgi:hypothetical protein
MDGVELERLPEELPGALDPEPLQDLVEAVGEVVEPVEADGRRDGEDGSEEDRPFSSDAISVSVREAT